MPNIEIKARYQDLDVAHAVARRLQGKFVGKDHQIDTYFRTQEGRLKLRESSLSGAQLVPYLRPNQAGPKKSDYTVIAVSNGPDCKRLLSATLGVDVVVDKLRDIYLIENVRVHLDEVKGLGKFFEFEAVYSDPSVEKAEYAKVENLMQEFQIKQSDLIQGSYRELMKEQNARL